MSEPNDNEVNQNEYQGNPGDMDKGQFFEQSRRDREYAQNQAREAAYAKSDEGQIMAWWNSFKEQLEERHHIKESMGFANLGYYEFDEETQTMKRKLIQGWDEPDPDSEDYDEMVKEGSAEPKSYSQISAIYQAMQEGRLFLFRPSKVQGDIAYRIETYDKNGALDIRYEDFDTINAVPEAPVAEPRKPENNISFFDRVKSFFGNTAAREKIDTYNRDLAKYNTDKAAWDKSYKNCHTPKAVTQQLNANRLAKNNLLKNDIKKVCDTYRRIEDPDSLSTDSPLKNNIKEQLVQRELEKSINETQKELAEIASALKSATGDKVEATQKSLEQSFGKYLAQISVQFMLTKQNPDYDTAKSLASDSNILQCRESLEKAGFVSAMMEKLQNEGADFSNLDSEKVMKSLVELQRDRSREKLAAEEKVREAKRKEMKVLKEKQAGSGKIFADVYTRYKNIPAINTREHWGIDKQFCQNVKDKTKINTLTLDRFALQTIACGLMLNDNQPLDAITGTDDKSLRTRKEYINKAAKLVVENKAQEIGETLLDGMEKVNNLLNPLLGSGEFTYKALLDPKNKNLVAFSFIQQDFYQEIKPVQDYLKEDSKLNPDRIEFLTTMNTTNSVVLKRKKIFLDNAVTAVDHVMNGKNTIATDVSLVAGALVESMIYDSVLKEYKSVPGNENKNITEIYGEDFFFESLMIYNSISKNKFVNNMLKRSLEDEEYASKVLSSFIDGSFEKACDFKIVFDKKDPLNAHFTVNEEALKKCIEDRLPIDFSNALNKEKAPEQIQNANSL